MSNYDLVVFDLDGTLLDSDGALVEPFVRLGMSRDEITFGDPVAEACRRWGIDLDTYVALYDTTVVRPYPGVSTLLEGLERWAVCSNKHPDSGHAELERLGWVPEVALFTDSFAGGPKRLGPVLDATATSPDAVLFVGDTAHDRRCALEAGCAFAWAGWNPRTRASNPEGYVLDEPSGLLDLLA
ncbi:MAG: HAD hydrolase-like protein [Microthrixaceae bacterium]